MHKLKKVFPLSETKNGWNKFIAMRKFSCRRGRKSYYFHWKLLVPAGRYGGYVAITVFHSFPLMNGIVQKISWFNEMLVRKLALAWTFFTVETSGWEFLKQSSSCTIQLCNKKLLEGRKSFYKLMKKLVKCWKTDVNKSNMLINLLERPEPSWVAKQTRLEENIEHSVSWCCVQLCKFHS